ncbi:hypothetical protein ACN28S_22330 [Cystobacter fuscus]
MKEIHRIGVANAGETTSAANDGVGSANSTFPGGSYYTYVDTSYTDANGYSLGDLDFREEYGGGKNVAVGTIADLSRSQLRRYKVSSYKIEETAAGFTDSYIYKVTGAKESSEPVTRPILGLLTINAPVDNKLGDGIIAICLDRTWTQDCDYDLTGTPQSIMVPLKGSIQLISAHVFDTQTIAQIRADLNAGVNRADVGFAELVLTNVGGGCDVINGNTLKPGMASFWNSVTVSANKKTFSWDLTGNNALFFDDGCRQVQDRAALTVQIDMPILSAVGNIRYSSSITLSNNPLTPRPTANFKPTTFTNSCLAEGTRIETAAGESSAIEGLKVGDHVSNPYRSSLTIMDTAVGSETTPMVRIRDEAKRTLLMTETHPIQVVARGMVQAKALRQETSS